MARSSRILIDEKLKLVSRGQGQLLRKKKAERIKRKERTVSKVGVNRYRLKVYSVEQIPNLELIAKSVIKEPLAPDESNQRHLLKVSLKVYSEEQVHNLAKIARGDFGSGVGVMTVVKAKKTISNKKGMSRHRK